jgi:hypothetical protein
MFLLVLCDNKRVFLYCPAYSVSFFLFSPTNKAFETQSASIIRCKEEKHSTQLGPLEGTSLNPWNGDNRNRTEQISRTLFEKTQDNEQCPI